MAQATFFGRIVERKFTQALRSRRKSDRSYSSPASLSLRIRQAGSRPRIFECGTGGGKSFGDFRSTAERKLCRQFPRTSRRLGGNKLALRSRNCAESSCKRTGCSAVTVQWLPWKWETCANRRKASRPGFAPSVKRRSGQASACQDVQQYPPRKGSSIGTWVLSGPRGPSSGGFGLNRKGKSWFPRRPKEGPGPEKGYFHSFGSVLQVLRAPTEREGAGFFGDRKSPPLSRRGWTL
jgi:hypothetical protein